MIDWSLPPELQKKYNEVVALTRKLQIELGIEPKTIEQRYQDYLVRQEEKEKQRQELEKLKTLVQNRRPPPRWKV